MRRRVDAARQAADDGQAARREIGGQPLGHRQTVRRRRARDPTIATAGRSSAATRSAHPEHRRRIDDRRQRDGIRGVAPGDWRDPPSLAPRSRPRVRARTASDAADVGLVAASAWRSSRSSTSGGTVARRAAARRSAATTRTAGARARRSRTRSVMAAPHQARRDRPKQEAGAAAPKRAGPDLTLDYSGRSWTVATTFRKSLSADRTKDGANFRSQPWHIACCSLAGSRTRVRYSER